MSPKYKTEDVTRTDLKKEFERLEELIEKNKADLDVLWDQLMSKKITKEEFDQKLNRLDNIGSTLRKNYHRTKARWIAESPYSYTVYMENIGRK